MIGTPFFLPSRTDPPCRFTKLAREGVDGAFVGTCEAAEIMPCISIIPEGRPLDVGLDGASVGHSEYSVLEANAMLIVER